MHQNQQAPSPRHIVASSLPSTAERLPSETISGRIIVHDRHRLQSTVLPVYFNHASFASLRRQLSYFSFVRVGKSRQAGVTYTNDNVVELGDILKLKRRGVGQAGAAIKQQNRAKKDPLCPPLPPPVTNQETQLAATSADVASAVLSGTLHAEKTNHNLDNNGATVAEAAPAPPRSSGTGNTSSATQSSISQSLESSSSSDGGSNKALKALASTRVSKKKSYKRRSTPKHPMRGKDRARLDRLLSINNVVPFIHLPHQPQRASPAASRKEETSMTGKEVVETKMVETKFAAKTTGKGEKMRERSDSGAMHAQALLALGAERQ